MKNSFLLYGQGGDGKISQLKQNFPSAPFIQLSECNLRLPLDIKSNMILNDGFIIVDQVDKIHPQILSKFLTLLDSYPDLKIIYITNNMDGVCEEILTRCFAAYPTDQISLLINTIRASFIKQLNLN